MTVINNIIFYALLWSVFWLPFIPVPNGVLCKNFMDLGLEIALLFWLIRLLITRKTGFKRLDPQIEKALGFIALASLLSIPFSLVKIWSIGDFLGILVGIFAVYLFTSAISNKEQLQKLWFALIGGITSVSILGLLQFFFRLKPSLVDIIFFKPFSFLRVWNHPTRISGTFISQSGVNVYSAFLIAIIALLIAQFILYKWASLKRSSHIIYLSCLILLLINLVLTRGRAAYIALFGALLFMFFQNKKRRQHLIITLLIISSLMLIFIPTVRITLADIFSTTSSSNQERLAIYKPALKQLIKKPIFGWGDGHSGRKVIFNKKINKWEESKDKRYFVYTSRKTLAEKTAYYKAKGIIPIQRPHNIYLTTFIETGILGFFALIYLFYTLITRSLAFYQKKKLSVEFKSLFLGLVGAFFTIVAYGFLHDSLNSRPYAILFWILIALTTSSIKLANKKR
ncbi:O-antigen ligase family protein [Candidatus Margulisiibacteriota bacterium]